MSYRSDRILDRIEALTNEQRKVALEFLSGYDLEATIGAVDHAIRTEPSKVTSALFYGRTWQFPDSMELSHSFLPHVSVQVSAGTKVAVFMDMSEDS